MDFSALLIREMKRVRQFAYSLCRDRDLAEDLMQDTLMKAIENQEKFEEGTNLRGWLLTICRNEYFSKIRRHKRVCEDPDGIMSARVQSNEDQLGALIAKDAISHIIMLPTALQRALMAAASGMTIEEMAECLSVPDGTVKSRVHRARMALSELIGEPLMALRSPSPPGGSLQDA